MIGPPPVLDAFDEGRTYAGALALAMGFGQRAVGRGLWVEAVRRGLWAEG
jgi:hypothetical protein